MSTQSSQERKAEERGIIITLISLVEKKESKSLRIACPIPPPLPACLRVAGSLAAVPLCGRLPLSPPGIPSSSRGVDRGSQGWTKQARSGPVGGLVWFGRKLQREREEEEIGSGVVFAFLLGWWVGLVGLACHETPTRKDNARG